MIFLFSISVSLLEARHRVTDGQTAEARELQLAIEKKLGGVALKMEHASIMEVFAIALAD